MYTDIQKNIINTVVYDTYQYVNLDSELEFEHILRNVFDCPRLGFGFVDVGLYRNPVAYDNNSNAIAIYLQCALIILANRKDGNEAILTECAKMLDENAITECAYEVINKLNENNIFY